MAGHRGPLIGVHRTVGSPGRHASAEADFDPQQTFGRVPSCKRLSYNSLAVRDLFDHLVGAQQSGGRHIKPERLSSLEVEHGLETGDLLHGQIRRLLAA